MSKVLSEFVESREFESTRKLLSDMGVHGLPKALINVMFLLLRGRETIRESTYDFSNRGTCYQVNRFAFEAIFEWIMRSGRDRIVGKDDIGRLASVMAQTMIPAKTGAFIKSIRNHKFRLHPHKIAEMHALALGIVFGAENRFAIPTSITRLDRTVRYDGHPYVLYKFVLNGDDNEYIVPILQTRQAKLNTVEYMGWWKFRDISTNFWKAVDTRTKGYLAGHNWYFVTPQRGNLMNIAVRRAVGSYLEVSQGLRESMEIDAKITEHRDSRRGRESEREYTGDDPEKHFKNMAWEVFRRNCPKDPVIEGIIAAEVDPVVVDGVAYRAYTIEEKMRRYNERVVAMGGDAVTDARRYHTCRTTAIRRVSEWSETYKFNLE